jgi:hypothetical protein
MPSIEKRVHAVNTTWRVVWRQDGRKQQQTFPTEKGAKQFFHLVKAADEKWPDDWVRGVGLKSKQPSTAPLFCDYAEKTINARQKADQRTKDDYKRILENHINPVIGNVPVDRIDRFQVSAVSDRLAAAGRSPKTVSNVHALMSSILSDAVTDRIIDRNPAVGAMPQLPDSKT